MVRCICLLFAFASVTSLQGLAQTQSPAQPIELPEFIVTGKEQVGVPGSTKQSPLRPPILASTQLDSLNPIEKLPLPGMPGAPLPHYHKDRLGYQGWLDVQMGNYLTPSLIAGYSLNVGGYLVDLSGAVRASNGWVPGSNYVVGGLNIRSTYVAPETFVVFGGSETSVDVGMETKHYNLYARNTAPSRTLLLMNAGVTTNGQWERLKFSGGLSFHSSRFSDSSSSANSNNDIVGKIKVIYKQETYGIGGVANLRLSEFNSQQYPFANVGITGETEGRALSAGVSVLGQYATTTLGESRSGVLLMASAQWHADPMITIDGSVKSGLRNLTVADMLGMNPYVAGTVITDVPYDVVDIVGNVRYHPVVRFTAEGGLRIQRTDRDLVWSSSSAGLFAPLWLQSSTVTIHGGMRYVVSANDAVTADVSIISSTVQGKNKPYVAPYTASAGYNRTWTPKLRSEVVAVFQGERYSDLANTNILDAFLDLRVRVLYRIGTAMDAFVRAENLVGSTMILWEGYRERGVFVSAGISWRF